MLENSSITNILNQTSLSQRLVLQLCWLRLVSEYHLYAPDSIMMRSRISDISDLTPWDLVTGKYGGSYALAIENAFRTSGGCFESVESVLLEDERSLSQVVKALSAWDIQHNRSEALAIYESFLKKAYPNFVASQGDFYTPQAVIQLMIELLNLRGGQIYDPCCGSGALLIMAAQELLRKNAEFSLYGQILDRKSLQICKTNFSCII